MPVYDRPTGVATRSILREGPGKHIERGRLAQPLRAALDAGGVVLVAGAGFGKTTVLEQVLAEDGAQVAWVGCTDTDRAPGSLLLRIVGAIGAVAPGATDVLAERLATAPTQIDPLAAATELTAELSRLLVEPVTLVIDDAEHLDGATGSLRLVDELLRSERAPLRVAVASRRTLDLHLAKPRAAGRLGELTAADLAFDAGECADVLRSRTGLDPSTEQVESLVRATEGWPMGVALAAELADRDRAASFSSLAAAADVRAFLSEELLESLDRELLDAAIDSSIVRVVSAGIAAAFGLPDDFRDRIERAGIMIRRLGDGAFAYHPLLRELLRERLGIDRDEDERRRLHGAVAPALAADGEAAAAIEHWLDSGRWDDAAGAIEAMGPDLVRSSPELVGSWISRLPAEHRETPSLLALDGERSWLCGDHRAAIPALRGAIAGFREHPDPPAEWLARSSLVDSLFAAGAPDAIEAVVEGWDQPAAEAAGDLAPAIATRAGAALASFGRVRASAELITAARLHGRPELLAPMEAIWWLFHYYPEGLLDEACAGLEESAAELERFDPLNTRYMLLGSLGVTYDERGYPERALETWLRIQELVHGVSGPVLAGAAHGWCALLHARAGRLAEAEAELAQYRMVETGTRSFVSGIASAAVAALRGDEREVIASAERALAIVAALGPLWHSLVAGQLVPALAAVDRVGFARRLIEDTLAIVDELHPAPRGCNPRGRLIALRAWLDHLGGDDESADAGLGEFWEVSGASRRHTLRRDWRLLEPLVDGGLERGVLEPEPAVAAISGAFPEGRQLVPFLDHPVAAVRRAALEPALRSGEPGALTRLVELERDPDDDLAAAAARAADRLGRLLPPLRFGVLGGFAVQRGSTVTGDGGWERPIDARLVRFLLVNVGRPVSEDVLFEALWPDREPESARRSLQVSVSRSRHVIDPPHAERSAIESVAGGYRLSLAERDGVDAEEFLAAVELALAEPSESRRPLLEHARALWGGEPMPEERYSDWATAYRERLVDRYIAVLTALIDGYAGAGDHAAAADAARDLVDTDALNEAGHRALMSAYARAGRRGHALRQYLECRRALVEGLGVEPVAETSRLQARILAGEII